MALWEGKKWWQMGRRPENANEAEELPAAVDAALAGVAAGFEAVGYPNEAMAALVQLALVEYRGALRAADRRQWHQQLLAVARQCGQLDEAEERGGEPPAARMDW